MDILPAGDSETTSCCEGDYILPDPRRLYCGEHLPIGLHEQGNADDRLSKQFSVNTVGAETDCSPTLWNSLLHVFPLYLLANPIDNSVALHHVGVL